MGFGSWWFGFMIGYSVGIGSDIAIGRTSEEEKEEIFRKGRCEGYNEGYQDG